jgi:hypothetical protein
VAKVDFTFESRFGDTVTVGVPEEAVEAAGYTRRDEANAALNDLQQAHLREISSLRAKLEAAEKALKAAEAFIPPERYTLRIGDPYYAAWQRYRTARDAMRNNSGPTAGATGAPDSEGSAAHAEKTSTPAVGSGLCIPQLTGAEVTREWADAIEAAVRDQERRIRRFEEHQWFRNSRRDEDLIGPRRGPMIGAMGNEIPSEKP